jgi:hypothetical protein
MSKRALVLSLLREAGDRGVTTGQFIEAGCGSRFGARVQELRNAGLRIEARPVRAGSHLYVLQQVSVDADQQSTEQQEAERLFEQPPARLNAALADWDLA